MGLDQNIYRKDEECGIVEELYFRKVNFLHGYLTEHAINADEVVGDNCVEFVIDRETLINLVKHCHSILELYFDEQVRHIDEELQTWQGFAEDNLPPTQGFFFGSYELDDFYLSQVQYVSKQVSDLLFRCDDDEFYYEAWY